MIKDILKKVEKQPGTLFYETSLKKEDNSAFLRLKERGLFICIQPNSVSETYSNGQQNPELLVNLDGHYWPINDQYSGKDSFNRGDLIKYRFSFETFARELAAANDLSGSPERLHRRIYYAGECTKGESQNRFGTRPN